MLEDWAAGWDSEDKRGHLGTGRERGPACSLPMPQMPSSADTCDDLLRQVRQLKRGGRRGKRVSCTEGAIFGSVFCQQDAGRPQEGTAAGALELRARRGPLPPAWST